MPASPTDDPLIRDLAALLGPNGLLTGAADTEPYCSDWRGLYHGRTAAVLRPADTASLAACVRACAEAGRALVPMGGNTSMVGGAAVSEAGDQLVLSLSRLNRIRAIDPSRSPAKKRTDARLFQASAHCGWSTTRRSRTSSATG